MAFTQFNDFQLIKVFDTGETVELGQFKPTVNGELAYIRVRMAKEGTFSPTNIYANLRLHSSSDLTTVYANSNNNTLVDVENASNLNTSGHWFSWVRFDFNRENLNKNITYYMSMTLTNYTRNADTFWIGISYDYPYPTYTSGATINNFTDAALSHQVFTYQEPV